MGRPFADELEKIPQTVKVLRQAELAEFSVFLENSGENHLVCIGAGGSFMAAELLRTIVDSRGQSTISMTPLAFLESGMSLFNTSVVIFSAGGRHGDVLATVRSAAEREAKSVLVVCATEGSKAQILANCYGNSETFVIENPAGKDGYLATNSLVAFVCGTLRATGFGLPRVSEIRKRLSADLLSEVGGSHTDFIIAVYGSWGKAAAIALESNFSEAGLGGVLLADYRNFAHGRHNWLDKQKGRTTVVFFKTPDCASLAERTLRLLPKDIPLKIIETEEKEAIGSFELLLSALNLTKQVGRIRGIDPGRPKVPSYGSRIYRLSAGFPISNSKVNRRVLVDAAIRRKARAGGFSQTTDVDPIVTDACLNYLNKLSAVEFGAIVTDFDGTVIQAGSSRSNESSSIKSLLPVLENGVTVVFSTGRGDSIHDVINHEIPEKYWDRVYVSYYHGAFTIPLSESASFEDLLPRTKPMEKVFKSLSENAILKKIANIRNKGCQVVVQPKEQLFWKSAFESVKDVLLACDIENVNVFLSSHSIDITPLKNNKSRSVDFAQELVNSNQKVLSFGDKGSLNGNDYFLLSHDFSLSVDEVSTRLDSCWNFLPNGCSNFLGFERYMSWLKNSRNGFKLVIPQ